MDFYEDRGWMRRRTAGPQIGPSPEFQAGVVAFLDFAYSHQDYVHNNKIRCPCKKCKLNKYEDRGIVEFHLLAQGFMNKYKEYWWAHGQPVGRGTAQVQNQDSNVYRMNEMVHDVVGSNFDSEERREEHITPDAKSFLDMFEKSKEPLRDGPMNWKDLDLSLRANMPDATRVVEDYEKLLQEKYPEEVQRPSFDQELSDKASIVRKGYVKRIGLKRSRTTTNSTATSANPSSQQTTKDLVRAICEDQSLLAQLREHIMSTLRPDEIAAAVARIGQSQTSNVQDQ